MTQDIGTGTPININSKSCITPETWQAMVGSMDKKQEAFNAATYETGALIFFRAKVSSV